MIPILYEKNETAFISNGLCRLRDCISAVVTEGRNSVYELDFDYPITGANYDLIQVGRIVGVTHDDTGDIQPFDIVSYTKPIDGIVSFHCVHISYRLSYMSIRSATVAINSLSDAFDWITTYAEPSPIPFNFWTDKTSTGYCSAIQSVPHTVKQVLGGIEGSILDAYGGEYEFDKWTVKLWSARGQYRDFSIRYGVNMLDYNEEFDTTGCYSSCRPYWTDGTTTVVGDKQTLTGRPLSGRDQCVPLDVSEYFESEPTKAEVEAKAVSLLNQKNPVLPSQNIEVSFVRLQDMGEYVDFQNLLQCNLCDTINVIFPDFNSSGTFKIVQTVWNVLTGKYESMELGDLSISLSDALGINDIQQTSKTTIEQMQSEISALQDNPWSSFVRQSYSLNHAISAGSSGQITQGISKSGYYPVGIIGYDIAGTASTWLFPFKLNLTSVTLGSATIYCNLRNFGTGTSNGTMNVVVLWCKATS